MRKLLMTTAAAVIAMPAVTTAAFAQQAETNTATGAEMQAQTNADTTTQSDVEAGDAPGIANPGGERETTAQAQTGQQGQSATQAQADEADPMSLDNVVASMEDTSATADAISSTEIKRVGVVRIDDTAGEEVQTRVDEAVAANPGELDELRTAIRDNQELAATLESGGLDLETIVAAFVTPDNDLVLFTRS